MKRSYLAGAALMVSGLSLLFSGCTTPQVDNSNQISPDADPFRSGMSSADIRNVAFQMCPGILSLPEIVQSGGVVRIKVADFQNTSRFFIDRNLFMKRLMVELNRNSRGKLRFISNNTKVVKAREEVLKDRQSDQIQQGLKEIAMEVANYDLLKHDKVIRIAVMPTINTNLVNMNADSFTAMLRSEISRASKGKIQFMMPGVMEGADYYMAGQFIPETMKKEGIINLAEYISLVDARVKEGKSMYIVGEPVSVSSTEIAAGMHVGENAGGSSYVAVNSNQFRTYETHLKKILEDPEMRKNPDVNKRLNIMIVDAKTKSAVYEKMLMIDRKITDNSGIAEFIISGEISGMHQRSNGKMADYLLISVQLINAETNEVIWQDAYEVKRMTENGVVYQ